MEHHLSPEMPDEDPAAAQLLAESQASSPVVLHPLKTSAARSASLLNAARIEKRPAYRIPSSPPTESSRTLAFSSPGGMAQGKIRTGKLRRPSFLGANMAKLAMNKSARRKNVYDLSVSPEKRSNVRLPESIHVKDIAPVKEGREQEAHTDLDEPNPNLPSTPPLMQNGVPQTEEESSIKTQLSDGRTRCTGIIRSEVHGHAGEQCPNEGLLETDAGSRCYTHVGIHQDAHITDSHRRKSGRLAGEEADIAAIDFTKKPEDELETPPSAKRKAELLQNDRGKANKSPRRDMKRLEQAGAVPGNERGMRSRNGKANPQVVVTPENLRRASRAKPGKPKGSVRDKDIETNNSAAFQEVDDHIPTTSGDQEDLPNTNPIPTRKKGRPRKNKATHTEPDAQGPDPRLNRPTSAAGVQEIDGPLPNREALEPVKKLQAHPLSNRGKKKTSTRRKAAKEAPTTRDALLEEQRRSDEAEDRLADDGVDESIGVHASEKEDHLEQDEHNIQQMEDGGDKVYDSNDLYNAEEGLEGDEDEVEERDTLPNLALDRVFAFVDSSAREGSCQTKFATKVKRLCDMSSKMLMESDPSSEQVAEIIWNIENKLASVSELHFLEDRKAVKGDGFAYLFRSLIRLLEAVHDWSTQNLGEPRVSLPALRVVVPLMRHIISFKRTITAWNVSIPSRYQGNRMVRDTEKNLIDPLLECEEDYSRQLRRLEEVEQAKQTRENLEAEKRQKQDEAGRREGVAAAFKAREARWKYLHFIRLQCEDSIDPRRRNRLRYRKLKATQEVDANGVPFEREPIFKDRSKPYLRPSPPPEEKAWTDEQLGALLDGLQECAGPDVFEKLFQTHCKFGGALRDFNVSDITNQAANLRSSIIDRSQTSGWEVEDWVKNIPVLP